MRLKIAILGAGGFIGSRAVEVFHLARLAEVRPIVRRFAGLARLSRFDLDCRIADALDQTALVRAFDGCEVVVHAVAGGPKDILGTLSPVYRAARQAGVRRLVYLSSAAVHGQAPEPGTTEDSPLSCRQSIPYNNAKVRAEKTLKGLRTTGTVETVILRPGIVFGPRSSWVAGFAEGLTTGTAYLINRGRGICNSIYVDNLIRAIYLAATAPGVDGEAFLLGDSETVSWADLYAPIAHALDFDLAAVPEAALPEPRRPTILDHFDGLRGSGPGQAFLSFFPDKWRQAAFVGLTHLRSQPRESPWRLPRIVQPAASLEMMLLYQCRYKLPYAKATKILGYDPVVSFEEGCRRTLAWLAFAGYPVKIHARGQQVSA